MEAIRWIAARQTSSGMTRVAPGGISNPSNQCKALNEALMQFPGKRPIRVGDSTTHGGNRAAHVPSAQRST